MGTLGGDGSDAELCSTLTPRAPYVALELEGILSAAPGYSAASSGSRTMELAGETWASCSLRPAMPRACCCLLVCASLFGALLLTAKTFLMHLADGQEAAELPVVGPACEVCPLVYYTALACVLAGRPLSVPPGDDGSFMMATFAGVYALLFPGTKIRSELEALLSSGPFQGGAAQCPSWTRWDAERGACMPSPPEIEAQCVEYFDVDDFTMGLYDPSNITCGANSYRRTSWDSWGGRCTCPDGREYLVADDANNCASVMCAGGKPGVCSSTNLPEDLYGFGVTCQPDIAASASHFHLADPEGVHAACWAFSRAGPWPKFVSAQFTKGCLPDLTSSRGKQLSAGRAMGVMEFITTIGKPGSCLTCMNLAPAAPMFGDFSEFYFFFNATPAGEVCREHFAGVL